MRNWQVWTDIRIILSPHEKKRPLDLLKGSPKFHQGVDETLLKELQKILAMLKSLNWRWS
jgi:hypothetical protein